MGVLVRYIQPLSPKLGGCAVRKMALYLPFSLSFCSMLLLMQASGPGGLEWGGHLCIVIVHIPVIQIRNFREAWNYVARTFWMISHQLVPLGLVMFPDY